MTNRRARMLVRFWLEWALVLGSCGVAAMGQVRPRRLLRR